MIYCLLFVPTIQKKVYKALKLELENNGSSSMLLKVYPKPGLSIESMEPQFSWSLAHFKLNQKNLDDGEFGFVLQGIWQYIPQSKYKLPVISVYRNLNQFIKRENLKQLDNQDDNQKKENN